MLGSAFVYAIALGIFTYFFYKIVIEYLYSNVKSIIMRTSDGKHYEVVASKVEKPKRSYKKKEKVTQITAETTN